jgi:hypothetical protein
MKKVILFLIQIDFVKLKIMSVSIAAMAATWRNVKLPDLQAELDEKATDLAAKSSESGE